MRFLSTPESALEREITVFAILETVFAIAASLFFALHYHVTLHIFAGLCLAPFLLLRTDTSTRLGILHFCRLCDALKPLRRLSPFGYAVAVSLLGIAVRIGITLYVAARSPLTAIRSMPDNWYRLTLTTDAHHPPEIVPGIETTEPALTVALNTHYYRYSMDRTGRWDRERGYLTYTLGGGVRKAFLVLLPVTVWRLSFKATSIIYLPFIWVARQTFRDNPRFIELLTDIKTLEIEKVKRVYAWIVIVVQTLIPMLLAVHVHHALATVDSVLARRLVEFYFITGEIQGWHIARFGTSLITLGVFYAGDLLAKRMARYVACDDMLLRWINFLLAVRTLGWRSKVAVNKVW